MSTIRPDNNSNNIASNATVRPSSNTNRDLSSTVRPKNLSSTVRPNGSASTVRPSAATGTDQHSTVRPVAFKTTRPNTRDLATSSFNEKVDVNIYQPRSSYTINGIEYNVVKALSLTSGEAQVFLVDDPIGKKHVLKLYYKGAKPNVTILNKVSSVNSASIFFHEESHGDFEDRYFELMKYYDGENLENVDVRKNETAISQYIGKMATAIDFCHQLGFIHRDIKPSNFIFETKEHKNILLGDFGIAVECDNDGQCVSDMARTKIYAAPEVYLNTGDGNAKFSTKSDFYSLGIVILFLWMGKDEFTHFEKANELQLATMKSYGNLPIPSTMPIRLYSLVKALIEPIPSDRAGFKEVAEWLKGGNPFGESGTQTSAIPTKKSFNVVFNGQKGLIATSPKELARIMFSNQQLAASYLYKGKVSQWLAENGLPELAIEMDRIKEDLFPRDTTAGLEAACYILNPSMPFVDICGNSCSKPSEIATSIFKNFDTYIRQLSDNPNSRLLIYLQTHGMEKATIDFRNEFAENKRLGLLSLVYRIDIEQPWRMIDDDGSIGLLNSCDEILDWVTEHAASEQSLQDIVSNAFFLWTKKRDTMIANAIKPLVRHNGDLSYSFGVLYRLNPKVGLYFNLDENSPNYILSDKDLAVFLNKCFMNFINNSDPSGFSRDAIADLLDISKGERPEIYHFLQAKGYDDKISWIKYCLDITSNDNVRKAGPYSETIGLFKLIKGMAGEVFYIFKSGKTIHNPSELSSVSLSDIQDAKEDKFRSLEAWIAVFYQEDPYLDKVSKYAFEQKTSEYINFLSSSGFDTPEIRRYSDSKRIVESRASKLRSALCAIKKSRVLISFISLLPLGVASLLLAFLWRPDFGSLEFLSVFKPVAIILTIILCFIDGLAGKVIGEAIWGCIIGAIISFVIVWLSSFAATLTPYIAAAIVAAIGIYFYNKCLATNLKEKENDELLNPDFEHLELEPLYEAFHPTSTGFDSSICDRTSDYQKELNSIKKTMWTKALPVGVITVIGIIYFLLAGSPLKTSSDTEFSDSEYEIEKTMPDFSDGLYGTWVGKIDGQNIQIVFEKSDNPRLFTFSFSNVGGSSTRFIFSGKYDSSTNELEVNKCRVSSELTVKVACSGTLQLDNDRISGDIEIKNPKGGESAMVIPINIQYVSE